MSRLKDISKYKHEILLKLISSENIVRALVNNQADFLNPAYPLPENTATLIYNNIFPYRKIPDVTTVQKTYITTRFGGYRKVKNIYKTGTITFFIFTHTDLLRTDYGELRTDFIVSEIDQLFNDSRNFGIGRLEFDAMDELDINDSYTGMWIRFKLLEFN